MINSEIKGPIEVRGRRIWYREETRGPYTLKYFIEDPDEPGKPERQAFATIDRQDELEPPRSEVIARCGSHVNVFRPDDHVAVMEWALGIFGF